MHLANAPLVHVLAQVVFAEVPNFDAHVGEVHSRLYDAGYVRRVDGVIHDVQITPDQPPLIRARPRWEFLDRERAWSVSLTDRFVVLATSRYISSEPFWERLAGVLALVSDVIDVQLVERVGLRYIDVIRPRAGESFSDYVSAAILGFPLEGLAWVRSIEAVRTEKLAATEIGKMIVRSMLLPPGAGAPPDVVTDLRHEMPGDPALPALAVDFDHFCVYDEPQEFEAAAIVARMEQLRLPLRDAFRHFMTDHAERVWGPWVRESGVVAGATTSNETLE